MTASNLKWDLRFLAQAKNFSSWSKDPSTKCGAVIVRPNKTVASMGYNGLPQKIADYQSRLENREVKYDLIIHAEMNAILFAGENLTGYSLYTWPFLPCVRCASHVVQAGIVRVVAPPIPEELKARWHKSLKRTKQIFDEAGIEYIELKQLS